MFSAESAPSFDSNLSSIYNPNAKTDQEIEIHTEVIAADDTAEGETYQALRLTDLSEEEAAQEDITNQYIRLEIAEADPSDTEDIAEDLAGRQILKIFARDLADYNDGSEEQIGYLYVEDDTAYIYAGDSEEAIRYDLSDLAAEAGEDTILDVADLLNIAESRNDAFVTETSDGQKVAYYVGNSTSVEDLLTAFHRVQLIYVEAAGSVVHEYISGKDVTFPMTGSQYAVVSCDKIALKAPVYWDDTNEILRYGAGQYMGSMLPGFGRMIVLSGHNNTFFAPLQNIEKNDVIEFDTNYCAYQYVVTDVQVMNENDLADYIGGNILLDDNETLVLYTCYPFYATIGRKTDRLVVSAERISGYDVKWRDLDE